MKLYRLWALCLSIGAMAPPLPAAGGTSAAAAARFLEQASWGPTAESIGRAQQVGFGQWLDDQLSTPPSDIPDAPAATRGLRTLQDAFFVNATHGQDQLRQRVAFALSQIWVVSGTKLNLPQAMAPYLRLLARDAFGNYYDLMRDMTLSPAMGRYLDMVNNDKPDPAAGKSADENYARELMQLFTLGEVMLNRNGTPQLDANGRPVPAYSEETVQNLARAFTGWTYPPAPGKASRIHNPANWDGPMVASAGNHDMNPKTLLNGVTLPGGRSPDTDLEGALQNIFNHPNVAPFVSKQLIQHLVASNPSPEYVGRIAAIFADNGSGVRGDLAAVVKAILLDPEARADDDASTPSAGGGHLREPVLYIAGLLRALNGTVTAPNSLASHASQMGQNVYYAPSVFNYFSPGYRVPGTPMLGPEFQIYSASTAMTRANFVNTLVFGQLGSGVRTDLTPFVKLAQNPEALVNALDATFLHGQMPSAMRQSILSALGSAAADKLKAQTAIYLVASSALYQVQH